MQSKSDAQLLREYAEHGAELAFTEIVIRHTNLVYSAAVRQMDSPDLAAEIAQSVFIGLARGARTLSLRLAEDASLAGWLCRSARNISLNLRRNEFRQHSRERQAMEHLNPTPETAPDWERLRPVLDDAMSELSEPDYDALVMRFFNKQDLRCIGRALGVTDDAAQKRVSRALDKLREYLSRRGISSTAAALSIFLSANAVQAAPAGLAVTISSAAVLAGTTLAATTTATAAKTIAMTTLQKTLVAAAIAAALGGGIYETRQASRLRDQLQTVQQQQTSLTEQIQQLKQEQEAAKRRFAALRANPQPAVRSNILAVSSSTNLPSLTIEAELERAHAETSPGRREAALKRIRKSIRLPDIPRALAFLAKTPGMSGVQSPLFKPLAVQWGSKDPDAALAWANNLPDTNARQSGLVSVVDGWAQISPAAAASYAAALPPGDLQDAAVLKVVQDWSRADLQAAVNWVIQFPEGKLRDQAVKSVVDKGNLRHPAAIAEMLDAFGSTEPVQEYGEAFARFWLSEDEPAARAWIERSPLSDERKQRLLTEKKRPPKPKRLP